MDGQQVQNGGGNKAWTVIIGFVALAVLAGLGYAIFRPEAKQAPVNSYEDCVRDGNYVTKTPPVTCVLTDGRRFVAPASGPTPTVPQPPAEGRQ